MRLVHIQQQRQLHGRRALAVLPVHYPKELLTAFNVLAVEMWGPPGPPRGEDAGRLQPYVCAVARNALAFLASGGADAVDGVLFPHTCDSLQGLATLVPDFGGWTRAAFVFQHARDAGRPSARAFALAELRSLARGLEAWTGRTLTDERLLWALRLHEEIDACRAALLDGRKNSSLGDRELYRLLRRGEWLWPEAHLAELRAARAAMAAEPVQRGLPVLVTGYVPEPPALLDALERAGLTIAADDYAAIGRRVVRWRGAGDPWPWLAQRMLSHPPCPTQSADQGARMRWLQELAQRSGARGVIVHVQKFCEPELFDVPAIRRALPLPSLVLEGELEAELPAQAVTRIEAFAEMLRAGARAA
ncbi:MAG TPA: 2-hydroxyacyl-CoA dehydratase family protein [Myxococcales bacterium]|nr:2-hydroxyacyl-CoA dehydratase family protein [Myxococcales bacterium]